ncbi:cytochrome b5 domain-containing protein [Nitrogeniibacter mangrovi]|uniref:Cytochrome b5 domain-containing protein n=1 Tax=Nitrogeniibacter mangrovi TaxID=2016596 RepID=A0A6C1B8R2_9RHOO|nr:cytochrome b5-like heme/steroid binding domain-containing protein [Nitrogeniibacter mangrovi]QID19349.1 cytochrome b5 domain-containing protein [Nitrogeniibacter mangrovi]
MMRTLFWVGTALFWCFVIGVRAAADVGPGGAPATPPVPTYTLAEVARHGTEGDCWMAIRGQVYDLSAYLPDHPTRPSVIVPWCGKEATEAYNTKTRGRPHSPGADQLLNGFRIGIVAP